MRVLVTGGAGDIGEYVVRELLRHGVDTTVLDIRPPRPSCQGVAYVQCDLTDLPATLEAVRDADIVVHLAAIPDPQNDPPDRVLSVNTVSTYNLLEAVRRNGVRRVVYGCSDSSTGFGIHHVNLRPLYLPIDEAHPCWPHETYSLSKRFGEEMLDHYARAYAIEGISLRYMWVWTARADASARAIVARGLAGEFDPGSWFGSYIAPHDVAQGVRLAVRYAFPAEQPIRFEAFYLCAPNTFLPVPTLKALAHHFDPLPDVRDAAYFGDDPYAPVFDMRKAQRLLGYAPIRRWQDYAGWPQP